MRTTEVVEVLTPVVAGRGLEIDRIEVLPAGRRSLLRIFLDGDGPAGLGPSLDDIAEATLAISVVLDESSVTGNGPYTLEVSSRGVGRPLTEPKHFRRNTGRLIAITGADLELTGRITGVSETAVTVEVDGAGQDISFDRIDQAVVQIEMNRSINDDEEE